MYAPNPTKTLRKVRERFTKGSRKVSERFTKGFRKLALIYFFCYFPGKPLKLSQGKGFDIIKTSAIPRLHRKKENF
jgi:hypothetical protein